MKKFYLFLASVLALVGIGVTHALVADVSEDFMTDDDFVDGAQVFIGNNITNLNGTEAEDGSFTHTFGAYKALCNPTTENGFIGAETLAEAAVQRAEPRFIWTLETAEKDGDGNTWFYLKNAQTGKYVSYTLNDQDPSDLDNLEGESGETDWWPEGEGDNKFANCKIKLALVDSKEEAKPFLFLHPEDGIWLVRPGYEPSAAVEDLMTSINDDCYMIIAKMEYENETLYAAMNSSGSHNGALSRYCDWASYYRVLMADCYDNPFEEFTRFMENVTIPSYTFGTTPGCVVEAERAQYVQARLTELNDAIDFADDYSDDEWRAFLVEVKSLLEEAETFTYIPMSAGYYRFISSFNPFEEQQGVKKAMYSDNTNAKWGNLDPGTEIMHVDTIYGENYGSEEDGLDPTDFETIETPTGKFSGLNQIWEVTEENGHFYVKNVKTQLYFKDSSTRSGAVLMTETPQWVEFILAEGTFNMKVENKGLVLHAGGHNSGAGVGGNIVAWDPNKGSSCSTWIPMPVTEEEIKSIWGEAALDQAALDAKFNKLLAEAKDAINGAQNSSKPTCEIIDPVIDRDNMIFTTADNDGTHVTSPCSDQTEGNIDNLLDGIEGDANNFWHSDWHGTYKGTWCNGYHYVEFDLKAEYQKLALYYVPRVCPAGNNYSFEGWPEEFTIYYTDTPDDEDSWKRGVSFGEGDIVADLHELRQNYLPFFIGSATRYVRVVCTKGFSWKNGHKFWMAGEMNFCTYEGDVIYDAGTDMFEKADSQGNGVATALVEAIKKAEQAKQNDAITEEEYEALKAAYDAFMGVYTDFTKLNAMVAEAKSQLSSVEAGTEPGQKPQEALDALKAVKDDVSDWIIRFKPTCTKADLDAMEAKMTAALEVWYATPVATINTNTWYYLSFASSRKATAKYTETTINEDGEEVIVGEELKESRLAAGYGDDDELDASGANLVAGAVLTSMFDDINDYAAQWRFINITDSTYVIQNRLTGNFIPVADESNRTSTVSLSPMPGRYLVNHLGDGTFEFATTFGYNNDGRRQAYVNMYYTTIMGLWVQTGKTDPGAKWRIREAEPIEEGYKQKLYIGLDSMAVRGLTLPYAINVSGADGDGLFYDDVVAINETEGAVGIKEATGVIAAGTPFFAFSSASEDTSAPTIVEIADNNFSWRVNSGVIRGTLAANDSIDAGTAVPTLDDSEENYNGGMWGALKVIKKRQHVEAGSAWLDIHAADPSIFEADVEKADQYLVLNTKSGKLEDAIQAVKVTKGKATIYNLNGQRVNKPAKGLYIIDGKKVVVK